MVLETNVLPTELYPFITAVTKLTPRVGFEPTTLRLTAGCSTAELSRIIFQPPLTFPSSPPLSIISRLRLNRRVRNGYGCAPQTYRHWKSFSGFYTLKTEHKIYYSHTLLFCQYFFSFFLLFRSSPRSISIGQLNTLLYLHLQPIYLVVFKGPYSLAFWDILS